MKGLPLLFITALLAMACGSNSTTQLNLTTDESVYQGKAEIASLNKASQMELAYSLLGRFKTDPNLPKLKLDDLHQLGWRFFTKQTQAMIQNLAFEATENQTFFSPSLTGLFGGKVDYSGKWDNEKGELLLNFDKFSPDGTNTWSGLVQINYTNKTTNDQFEETSIQFIELECQSSNSTYQLRGTLKNVNDPYTGNFQDKWNLHIYNDGLEYKLEDFLEEGFKTHLEFCRSKLSGNFYHHQYGKIKLTTEKTIEFNGRTPSFGGPIYLKGANNSSIKISPEGFGLLHFELDANGDGEFESIISQTHAAIEVY